MRPTIVPLCGALFLAGLLPAQGAGRADETKELIQKIEKEMELIDKLLNQAAQKQRSGGSGASGVTGTGENEVKKLLETTVEASRSVVDTIDKLLEKARQQQSNSSSQPQDQQQQQRNDQRNRERRPDDRMQDSPDLVERERQQREREQRQRQGDPDNPRADPDKGKQEKGADRAYPPGKRFDKDAEQGRWGDLPKYLQILFERGGTPKVPSKYKRFREEFHKRADRGDKKK